MQPIKAILLIALCIGCTAISACGNKSSLYLKPKLKHVQSENHKESENILEESPDKTFDETSESSKD